MVTTRGCPYHCNWCAKPIYGQVYNTRSPENVVQEMLHLKRTLAPDHIWFCDDIFGLTPGWIDAFSREVVRQQGVIPFKCLGRVDLLLKEQTITRLREAGCRSVWVGAESGSQKILDAMEKGTTVPQIYEASARLHEAGIGVGFFLQFGYPGETEDDIRLTLKMVKECLPDDIGISVSYPLPGTPFYERVRKQLGAKQNWIDSMDLDVLYQGTFPREYYRALHRYTHKQFRYWQGLRILGELARAPRNLSMSKLRRIAGAGYHALTVGRAARNLSRYTRCATGMPKEQPAHG